MKRIERLLESHAYRLERENAECLSIAGKNPPDPELRQQLVALSGKNVKFKKKQIGSNPRQSTTGMVNDVLQMLSESSSLLSPQDQGEDIEGLINKEPIIQFVNLLFENTIQKNASDIHIEPFKNDVKIRFRIDGVLHDYPVPHRAFYDAIVSRIKIISELDIAQKRMPQDGRYSLQSDAGMIDFRISTVPTLYGESVVIRILNKKEGLIRITDLGWERKRINEVKQLLNTRQGMVLVTGPTGSGKSTTLYAFLQEINDGKTKIITIEDPVEYQLEGINQIAVNHEIDLTFAKGLRSILRQDPDTIMVGEIRDKETAKIAVQSSLTGHLVLSTVHTNDSIAAVSRMVDLGVENYLLAPALRILIAQRLIRRVCPKCKAPYTPDPQLLEKFNLKNKTKYYAGKGCKACENTGYKGRIAIFEALKISEDIREAIVDNASERKIREIAVREGFKTLLQDACEKIKADVTTPEEVSRVVDV